MSDFSGTIYSISFCANISGAGLYEKILTQGSWNFIDFESHPIANNSVIVSGSEGLRVQCISNSSLPGVGSITILNGSTLSNADIDVWNIINPYNRPGFIQNNVTLTSADQGIYTCTIADSNGNQFVFNFGLYPNGFMGKREKTYN